MARTNTVLSLASALCALTTASCILDFGKFEEGAGGPCGNGVLEAGEQCDDGNRRNGDSCSSTCQVTVFDLASDIGDYAGQNYALRPSIATTVLDGAPGFLVAWTEQPTGVERRRLALRTYSAAGAPVEPAPQLLYSGAEDAICSSMASNAEGRAIVSWMQGTTGDYDVQWLVIEPGGQPSTAGSQTLVDSASGNFSVCPTVGAAPSGELCILWHDSAAPVANVRASCMDAAGNLVGPSSTLGPGHTGAGTRLWGGHALVGVAGGFVASWLDGTTEALVGQALDTTGAPQGASVILSSTATMEYVGPGLGSPSDSAFTAVYGVKSTFGQTTSVTRVLLRRFSGPDAPLGDEALVTSEHVEEAGGRLAAGPDGRFAALLSQEALLPSLGCTLLLQRYSADGTAVGAPEALLPNSPAQCGLGAVGASTPEGDLFVVWALWDTGNGTTPYPRMRTQGVLLPHAFD
jgi:cysteine-rich repeat protein